MRFIDVETVTELRKYLLENRDVKSLFFHESYHSEKGIEFVQVVRCKECRFYLQSNEKCELVDTRLRFYETDKTWTGDCFCSWGERTEDATKH